MRCNVMNNYSSRRLDIMGFVALDFIHPHLLARLPINNLLLLEPQGQLTLGRLIRIGSMDQVPSGFHREITSDGSIIRCRGLGRSDHLSCGGDDVQSAVTERDDGPRAEVLDQIVEEGLALVLGVVGLCELTGGNQDLDRAQLQALPFESAHDLGDEAYFQDEKESGVMLAVGF